VQGYTDQGGRRVRSRGHRRIEISASREQVWTALTDPEQIKKYMFGSQVVTDWEQGSPIV
jgi:Activator of Hsp90 ATPase homolog 1-like protein